MTRLNDIETGPVLLQISEDGIATVSLNRPEARNAINVELAQALSRIVEGVERDSAIKVVILHSTDKRVFCAGADLKDVAAGRRSQLRTETGGFAGLVFAARSKPWIAAVDGFAVAGGFELALACDMIVAGEDAQFGLPEVKRGIVAGAGGLYRLPRAIPRHVANQMLICGATMDARRAYGFGLVTELAAPGESYEQALALAGEIAANAPVAVRESLRVARAAHDVDEEGLKRMSREALAIVEKTHDYYEGARAFVEKRAPVWRGE